MVMQLRNLGLRGGVWGLPFGSSKRVQTEGLSSPSQPTGAAGALNGGGFGAGAAADAARGIDAWGVRSGRLPSQGVWGALPSDQQRAAGAWAGGRDADLAAGGKGTPRPSATPRGSASHPHRGEGFLSATPRTQSGRAEGERARGVGGRGARVGVALSAVDPDGHILPNVTRIDRFDIVRLLDKGTFGTVFEAYDNKWHHNVALKVVRRVRRYVEDAEFEVSILNSLADLDHKGVRPYRPAPTNTTNPPPSY